MQVQCQARRYDFAVAKQRRLPSGEFTNTNPIAMTDGQTTRNFYVVQASTKTYSERFAERCLVHQLECACADRSNPGTLGESYRQRATGNWCFYEADFAITHASNPGPIPSGGLSRDS